MAFNPLMSATSGFYQFVKNSPALWVLYGAWRFVAHRLVAIVPRSRNVELLEDYRTGPQPTLNHPVSQLCTAAQCNERVYAEWCAAIRSPVRYGRKQWEHVFILETLRQHGMIREGARGVGFGCGREPSVAVLASRACQILATDLSPDAVAGKGWTETGQHASSFEALNEHGLCDPETFRRRVSLRYVDMNAVPGDIADYDFTWSSCALEHLGSLRHGLDFIKASIRCLRPGGVAVHTTEFNLSSNEGTLEDVNCVVYRRKDIEAFAIECAAEGIELVPCNWQAVSGPLDEHVDTEPYGTALNLKLRIGGYVCTSIGLIFRKGAATAP
jgi:SAM-dependent methyltransferase